MTAVEDPEALSTKACFVCSKHRQGQDVEGGILYRDDTLYAGHCHLLGRDDILLGWLIIEPLRHVAELGDLTDGEAAALGTLASRLARGLQQSEGAEHVYSFVFGDGLAAPHLHLHLIPRYPGTPREYWGQRVPEWPDAPRGGVEAMTETIQRLRLHLSDPRADGGV
jgi:diadenosine tetraphosphate (Ap4A) HIT family hydrolase